MNKSKYRTTKGQSIKSPKKCANRSMICFSILLTLFIFLTLGLVAFQSLEKVLLAASTNSNLGYAYVQTGCQNNSSTCAKEAPTTWEKYGGKLVGTIQTYHKPAGEGAGGTYRIIEKDAVMPLIITNPALVPEDKIPIIIPKENGANYYDEQSRQKALTDLEQIASPDSPFMAVGSYESSALNNTNPGSLGLFSPLLKTLTPATAESYLVDTGNGRIDKYLESVWGDNYTEYYKDEAHLVRFDSYEQAINYAHDADKIGYTWTYDIFGNGLIIDYTFGKLFIAYYILLGLVGILALVELASLIYTTHQLKH